MFSRTCISLLDISAIYRLWLSITDCPFQQALSWHISSIVFIPLKEVMWQSKVLSFLNVKLNTWVLYLALVCRSNAPHLFRLQVGAIFKTFLGSFSWSMFKWFYTGGEHCGFDSFPMFGLDLYKHRWEIYFKYFLDKYCSPYWAIWKSVQHISFTTSDHSIWHVDENKTKLFKLWPWPFKHIYLIWKQKIHRCRIILKSTFMILCIL